MKLVSHDDKGATLYLDKRELLLVAMLIQEGRASFESTGPTGKAVDELFRTALMLVDHSDTAANRSSRYH